MCVSVCVCVRGGGSLDGAATPLFRSSPATRPIVVRDAFSRRVAIVRTAVSEASAQSSSSDVNVTLGSEQLLQSTSDAYITSMSRDSTAGVIYYTTQQGGIYMFNESSSGERSCKTYSFES
jgi:hypothetical protein